MTDKLPHEKLAEALDDAGLHDMARRAREFYYHDFKSPLDLPEMQLDKDLSLAMAIAAKAERNGEVPAGTSYKIKMIRQAHHNGDWDATSAESEEWMQSEEGRATIAALFNKRGL